MSWIDDNLVYPPDYYYKVRNWENGIHVTKNGTEIKIESMTENHLKNTIKHFRELDTSCLKKELKNRNRRKND